MMETKVKIKWSPLHSKRSLTYIQVFPIRILIPTYLVQISFPIHFKHRITTTKWNNNIVTRYLLCLIFFIKSQMTKIWLLLFISRSILIWSNNSFLCWKHKQKMTHWSCPVQHQSAHTQLSHWAGVALWDISKCPFFKVVGLKMRISFKNHKLVPVLVLQNRQNKFYWQKNGH